MKYLINISYVKTEISFAFGEAIIMKEDFIMNDESTIYYKNLSVNDGDVVIGRYERNILTAKNVMDTYTVVKKFFDGKADVLFIPYDCDIDTVNMEELERMRDKINNVIKRKMENNHYKCE